MRMQSDSEEERTTSVVNIRPANRAWFESDGRTFEFARVVWEYFLKDCSGIYKVPSLEF